MKKTLFLLTTAFFLNNVAYSKEGRWDVLHKSSEMTQGSNTLNERFQLRAKVLQVYENYSASNSVCNYQPDPKYYIYPQTTYTLTNPYAPQANEEMAFRFKIRNFVINGPQISGHPECGKISIKCASYQKFSTFSNFYCERIHNGLSSEPALLSNPQYNKYLAYQTIYNNSVMPKAKKYFGWLTQFYPLDTFSPYSESQVPNPSYEYSGAIYTGSPQFYPDPINPPPPNTPNYNNGGYGGLFIGSAENLKSICQSIRYDNLSLEDAGIRFNESLGLPPDSPDVQRTFVFVKLRNNPHISGNADGNMFRPCPIDGNLYGLSCPVSALVIPHDCNTPPPPYDGTTVSLFLMNQYYSSYCNATPNKQSGMPIHYPWTGQGFTYDWYPWNIYSKNVQGASEYVAAINNTGNYNIQVNKQISLTDFLSTCDFS